MLLAPANEYQPLRDRFGCSIVEALDASGLGRTKFYELIESGTIRTKKVGRRRIVVVSSLIAFIEGGES